MLFSNSLSLCKWMISSLWDRSRTRNRPLLFTDTPRSTTTKKMSTGARATGAIEARRMIEFSNGAYSKTTELRRLTGKKGKLFTKYQLRKAKGEPLSSQWSEPNLK